MTKLNIKTLGELLEKDKKGVGDVKRMIDRYGIYYWAPWKEWEAAPKDVNSSEQIINNAISALCDYADIFDKLISTKAPEEFYDNPGEHDIYRYGFNQDESGDLFVEKTHIQTLEEKIESLKEENKRLGGVYESQVDKELVAPELELANQIYREALKKRDPKTNKVEGKTPSNWMKGRLGEINNALKDSVKNRIAAVANWSKEQTNKK